MVFYANHLSALFSLIGIHSTQNLTPIARHGVNAPHRWINVLRFPCFILLFKFLITFFMQGPGQVLLNSGSPPIMQNLAECGKLRPILGAIPEN